MRASRIAVLALAVVGAAGVAYLYLSRPVAVEVAVATRGDAAEIVYATGVVEPRTWAKVTPLVRERIVELCGCEGREVAKGDVLARLDDREAQATLDELVARHRYASRELERLRDLAARNVSTLQELERAESEAAQLEASIARQRTRLESYLLRSPSDGVVLRQDGEVGRDRRARNGALLGRPAAAAPDRGGGERGGHPARPARPAHAPQARTPFRGGRWRPPSAASRPWAIRSARPTACASTCPTTRRWRSG